jgi:hypothetical protein
MKPTQVSCPDCRCEVLEEFGTYETMNNGFRILYTCVICFRMTRWVRLELVLKAV